MLLFLGNDSAHSPSFKNVQKEPPEMAGHFIPTVSARFWILQIENFKCKLCAWEFEHSWMHHSFPILQLKLQN